MICIHGKRLILRAMTREEYHAFQRGYVPDPAMDPDPYRYDAQRVDARYDLLLSREAWYPELGIFRKDGAQIGLLAIKRIDREASRCELGLVLQSDRYKEKGYGGEAFSLALDYAFETLGLQTVYADTMDSNIRMRRILEKLGFECFLRLEGCYDMRGRWEDRLDYRLRHSAWTARREGML